MNDLPKVSGIGEIPGESENRASALTDSSLDYKGLRNVV